MPLGAATSQGSGGELICHFTGFRIRAVGSGNLRFRFMSMDSIYEQVLNPMALSATTNIQPFRLANFTQQRAQLEIKTTAEGENFTINRIIIYGKQLFTMHPG